MAREQRDGRNCQKKLKKTEDKAAVIREFEVIKRTKRNIWLAHQQGKIFEKFKENAKFIEIVKQFEVSKSTIIFIVKLINKYPHPPKKNFVSFKFYENYFKIMKGICQDNSSESV